MKWLVTMSPKESPLAVGQISPFYPTNIPSLSINIHYIIVKVPYVHWLKHHVCWWRVAGSLYLCPFYHPKVNGVFGETCAAGWSWCDPSWSRAHGPKCQPGRWGDSRGWGICCSSTSQSTTMKCHVNAMEIHQCWSIRHPLGSANSHGAQKFFIMIDLVQMMDFQSSGYLT